MIKHFHSQKNCFFDHHPDVNEKSIFYLTVSFVINMLLSIIEFVGGILAGSIALIGDALHNTSDALSILVAIIAFKIGRKKASTKYTYGYKRAEVIGGFVNLILLFISGIYLLFDGILRLIAPQQIDGRMILWISLLALIIDALTAQISHKDAKHNTNMKMVFIHNLADAFGSLGAILSGLLILYCNIYWADGVIALFIAFYMIFQAAISFPKTIDILMNAAPENIDILAIKNTLCQLKGVKGIHHIHLWRINEYDVSLECHIEADDLQLTSVIRNVLYEKFNIKHCTIQLEDKNCCQHCHL
ncbi:MAG: cation transporter [Alphaproteobacteria bacterium]|nr:cation transporter [Alphaproteobacteria bacterium]